MKNYSFYFYFILFFSITTPRLFSQCFTDTSSYSRNQLDHFHPDENARLLTNGIDTVPVLIHVFYSDLYYPHFSQTALQAMLDTLNMGSLKQNADTADVSTLFRNNIGRLGVYFKLASKDTNGNCISPISYSYWDFQNGLPNLSLYVQDPRHYLNIFINGNVMSGANYPTPVSAGPTPWDFINIIPAHIQTKTITHEVGHYFGLLHTFGNTNTTGVCGNDSIADTPMTAGSNYDCDTSQNYCVPGIVENVENYMDYSDPYHCYKMFTNGQVNYMRGILNSSGYFRSQLIPTNNLIATGVINPSACAIISDFHTWSSITSCATTTISALAMPQLQLADSVSWFAPAANPITSISFEPDFIYNSSGNFPLTLIVWHNGISDTSTQNLNIAPITSNGLTPATIPFSENFESGFTFNGNLHFRKDSATTVGWLPNNTIGYNSQNCIYVPLETIPNFQTDSNSFRFGNIDFTGTIHPHLQFRIATANNNSNYYPTMRIFMSQYCANTVSFGGPMAIVNPPILTSGILTSNFIPADSTQWGLYDLDLTGFANEPGTFDFKIRFEKQVWGPGLQDNYVFIDNINIIDFTPPLSIPFESESELNCTVFPNPTDGKISISINSNEKVDGQIRIYDITGNEILKEEMTLNLGEQTKGLSIETLDSGIYIIEISTPNYVSRIKFIKK